jgi:hypothetical protein
MGSKIGCFLALVHAKLLNRFKQGILLVEIFYIFPNVVYITQTIRKS